MLVVAVVISALLGSAAARAYPTTDLFCFVTGARLVISGADPYDAQVWAKATAGESPDYRGVLRPRPCPGRFGYPLWTALLLIPLTWLDMAWVGFLWQFLLFAGAAIGVVFLARAIGNPRIAVTLGLITALSQPFWLTVVNAQFGGILLGALGVTAALLTRRRDLAAGASLAVLWLKPHVVLLTLIAVPVAGLRAGRRGIAVAAVGAILIEALASIVARPGWPRDYLTELLQNRSTQTLASTSLVGLSSALTGSVLPGVIAAVTIVAAGAVALRGRKLNDIELLSFATASTLVLSPYLGSHDHLLLDPAWARILVSSPRSGAVLAGLLAVVLPWSLYAFRGTLGGAEGLCGLVPAFTLVALAVVLRRN